MCTVLLSPGVNPTAVKTNNNNQEECTVRTSCYAQQNALFVVNAKQCGNY
jgi:hypothetical protein